MNTVSKTLLANFIYESTKLGLEESVVLANEILIKYKVYRNGDK